MSRKKWPGGRPAKISEEIITNIREALTQGHTIKKACSLAGISYPSFYRWRKIGSKKRRGIYHAFFVAIELVFFADRDRKGRRTWKSYGAEYTLKRLGTRDWLSS